MVAREVEDRNPGTRTLNHSSVDRSTNQRFDLQGDHDSSIRIPTAVGTRAPNQPFGLSAVAGGQRHPRAAPDASDLWIRLLPGAASPPLRGSKFRSYPLCQTEFSCCGLLRPCRRACDPLEQKSQIC
jgi:hypothetical protein